MFNEKKVAKNISRLYKAVALATDVDFAITYVCVTKEYEKRKKKGEIDNYINDIKVLIK